MSLVEADKKAGEEKALGPQWGIDHETMARCPKPEGWGVPYYMKPDRKPKEEGLNSGPLGPSKERMQSWVDLANSHAPEDADRKRLIISEMQQHAMNGEVCCELDHFPGLVDALMDMTVDREENSRWRHSTMGLLARLGHNIQAEGTFDPYHLQKIY